jgi:hypothetical protein
MVLPIATLSKVVVRSPRYTKIACEMVLPIATLSKVVKNRLFEGK